MCRGRACLARSLDCCAFCVRRYVISPTVPVQLALLSQLSLPARENWSAATAADVPPAVPTSTQKPNSAGSNTVSSFSNHPTPSPSRFPLAYSLQLFDAGKDTVVSWGASYKLVAEALCGSNGRAILPSVQLQPSRYLVVLQLQPGATCQQWVDPLTGNTELAPNWQLLLLPSADDKVGQLLCLPNKSDSGRHVNALPCSRR